MCALIRSCCLSCCWQQNLEFTEFAGLKAEFDLAPDRIDFFFNDVHADTAAGIHRRAVCGADAWNKDHARDSAGVPIGCVSCGVFARLDRLFAQFIYLSSTAIVFKEELGTRC